MQRGFNAKKDFRSVAGVCNILINLFINIRGNPNFQANLENPKSIGAQKSVPTFRRETERTGEFRIRAFGRFNIPQKRIVQSV